MITCNYNFVYNVKMKIAILLLLLVFGSLVIETEAVSCELMGRGGCIISCKAQNCATGYCTQGTTGICICTRCRNGR